MKRISLVDLSEELGVSKSLISLVLNGKGDKYGINKETQKKVLKVAKAMNYKPNVMAKGLRTGHSNTIGLIVANIANPFYAYIARKIEDETSSHGYNLFICSSDENAEKEKNLIKMLIDRNVDGLIISSTLRNSKFFKELQSNSFPFVLIDRHFSKFKTNEVHIDNFEGAKQITTHLIRSGHKKIACLSVSPEHISSLKKRKEGFLAAIKEEGLNVTNNTIVEIPYNEIIKKTEEQVKALLQKKEPPTAFFTTNNLLATATMLALKKLDKKIPQDIALVTFDNIEIFEMTDPPITAVAQPQEEIAKKAVELLMQCIKDDGLLKKPQIYTLKTKIIHRKSV